MKKKIAAMLVIMSLACIQLAGCGQEEKKTEDNKKTETVESKTEKKSETKKDNKKTEKKDSNETDNVVLLQMECIRMRALAYHSRLHLT